MTGKDERVTRLPKVLLTAFEPFDGEQENASQLALRLFSDKPVPSAKVVTAELPTVFGASLRKLRSEIRIHKPDVVICLGQAAGRKAISLERVAINVDDARIPDNAGAMPIDQPISRSGPAAYWSTLPIKQILEELREIGLPAEVSETAGTFVCNHVFYGLMRTLKRRPGVRGGFVHVPVSPAQAKKGAPSLPIEEIARGLRTLVRVSAQSR